jgi:diguanylate cyclase (GGDEF)-like protein
VTSPPTEPTSVVSPPTPSTRLLAVEFLVLAGAIFVAVITGGSDSWKLPELGVLVLFAVISDLSTFEIPSAKVLFSGGFLAVILTAVLLGGAPAAAVGAIVVLVVGIHARQSRYSLLGNLVICFCYPLAAGLFFRALLGVTQAGVNDVGYYLLVFLTVNVALGINIAGVAGYQCLLYGDSLRNRLFEMKPVLASELFSALLSMAAVYVAVRTGTVSLALIGLVIVVFQYLTGELLKSRQRSQELQRIATTDELTGLANRERFSEAIQERVALAKEEGGEVFAVMLMDLDRFKEINDTLGHHYGDVLLRDLGPRLVSSVGPGGLVARLGGDEFGILLEPDVTALPAVEQEVSRLTAVVGEPFSVDELSLEVGASIGIARYPQDGEDSHALLRCADIAMYAAKEAQADYKVYAAEQNQHSVRRLSVLSDIRHALASDQIVVHYQPIVDLDDLSVTGAEGLVRWQHPELGLIPPGAFVNTVEQTGLIGPLTRYILERAIAECAAWRKDRGELSVAVNLSVRNLLDRDLPREIERLLDVYGLPAGALQLEITESMIMSDPDRAVATVTRLSALGVRMSVDDFGTGYSSLANLRRLPIDDLKIDRSFVSPMLNDESDLIIVRSTINLGHDLGLKVIAEGVEDGDTLQRLALLGCDLAQGYHLSRPLPPSDFERWLQDKSPPPPPVLAATSGRRAVPDLDGPPAVAASGG